MLGALGVTSAVDAAQIAIDVGQTAQEETVRSARGRPPVEFNRELAMAIADALRKTGQEVTLTDSGVPSAPGRRVKGVSIALLVSVQQGVPQDYLLTPWTVDEKPQRYSDRFTGFSLFVSHGNPQAAKSEQCAAAIGTALRGAGFKPSLFHADQDTGENRPFADRVNGVHYFDTLPLLRRAQVPAVVLEAGIIANRDEEQRLRDPAVRTKLAEAMAKGIATCVGSQP